MKYSEEASILYNKISKESGMNEEALILIGINKQMLSDALKACIDRGVGRKAAISIVYNTWLRSNPAHTDGLTSPSDKELKLMGFINKGNQWIHSCGVKYTIDDIKNKSFRDIENDVASTK